jgi:hypothetical protein
MKQLLMSLIAGVNKFGNTAKPAARRRTTQLQVEKLEERAVPTANLTNTMVPFGNGTLYVNTQKGTAITGYFYDNNTHQDIQVTGSLMPGAKGVDQVQFQGSYGSPVTGEESVSFKGTFNEATRNMTGALTEVFSRLGGFSHGHHYTGYVETLSSNVSGFDQGQLQ